MIGYYQVNNEENLFLWQNNVFFENDRIAKFILDIQIDEWES